MFGYYLRLALRSFGRNKLLTSLMVLAIAMGIGASMTTLTVFKVLSGDPIPQKSQRLFHVQLDPRPAGGYVPGEEPALQLSRLDAEELLRQKKAPRQAMMSGVLMAIEPDNSTVKPFNASGRATSADFFAMFDTPFRFGNGWTADDDARHARIAVIGKELNNRLFDGADSIGKPLRVAGTTLRIVGVVDDWMLVPKFYDTSVGRFGSQEQIFLPFATAMDMQLEQAGNMSCFGDVPDDQNTALNAPCVWVQYWAELDTAEQAGDYKAYLESYSTQQHAAGRFQRAPNVRLRDVMQLLEHRRVVPSDVRLQMWLALGFLAVCLVNTVGLLLAKFLRRSGEIGVRRALGASRGAIFAQALVEAGSIGIAGGVGGLLLAVLGLWAVRQQPVGYAKLAHLDVSMLLTTFALALLVSLLAGLLPAWRAMQIAPALQLKSQ